jgi:pimeloyl-ACP methyl ester carboxylesterase
MARHLSSAGFDVFRFDFAGVGDSPARTDGQSLGDGVVLDLQETMDHLEQTLGCEKFVVIGLCSGADNGMRAAEVDMRITGLALLDPTIDRTRKWYLHYVWRRISSWTFVKSVLTLQHPRIQEIFRPSTKPETGEKPELYQVAYADRSSIARCLEKLIDRQVRLFAAFTGSWRFIYNYPSQFYDVYSGIDFKDALNLTYRPEVDHCYLDSAHREKLLQDLTDWCNQFCDAKG